MDYAAEYLAHPFTLLGDSTERLSLLYMLTALIAALGVYFVARRRGKITKPLMHWLLPREVLTHQSAKADYVLFFVNKSLFAAIWGSLAFLVPLWLDLFMSVVGPMPQTEPTIWRAALLTLIMVLVLDATLWFAHYLFHRIPVLWEFHKVHHSAEVMTPLTATRMHPVEEGFSVLLTSFVMGFVYAIVSLWLGSGAFILSLLGNNIVLALFFLAAFNLRHSHVWLRYPLWLQHIFVSPAQHQIHHSRARRHWDRNMGFIFAIWDWAAGTLYAPRTQERIEFGLGNGEDGTWNTPGALYFRPFRNAWALIRKGPRCALSQPLASDRVDHPAE